MPLLERWQGVTTDGKYIYVVTDRNDAFALENIISVYTLDGNLLSEKRNAYTGTDTGGRFMSFGDMSFIDGLLYVTAYNFNSGGPSPYQSHVVKYNTQDNGLNQITVNNIGTGVAEGIDKHLDDYWVSYHDIQKIRRFDASWVQKVEYNLPTVAKTYGGY